MRARQLSVMVVTVALLAGPLAGAQAAGGAPPGYTVTLRQTLAAGVEHLRLRGPGPQDVHLAHVSPGARNLRVVQSHGRIVQSSSGLERPDALCRSVGCLVAVNGDFIAKGSQPFGAVVSQGVLLRSPGTGHSQVWVTPDGSLGAGGLGFSGRVEDVNHNGFAVGGVNVDRQKDQVTVYTPAYGSATPSGKGVVELVARAADPGQLGLLGVAANLTLLQLRTTGATPLSAGVVVLSAQGKAAASLKALWDRRNAIGSAASLTLVTAPAVAETIGINPVILHNGQRVFPTSGSFIKAQEPRTVLAWNQAGDMWLITVDGRQASSKGWTMAEAAGFAAGVGASEAVNFDGGGGTTFVVQGNVVNSPSDKAKGNKPGTVRRAVNALTVN